MILRNLFDLIFFGFLWNYLKEIMMSLQNDNKESRKISHHKIKTVSMYQKQNYLLITL